MILLNPGPVNVSERVRQALLKPDICHRESEFLDLLQGIQHKLLRAFVPGAESDYAAVVVTGSGTAAVEAALFSSIPHGKRILVLNNGVYGERMTAMVAAHKIGIPEIKMDWLKRPDPAQLVRALQQHPEVGAVAMVHHETTTGLINPVAEIAEIVDGHNRVFLLDSVSGLGGEAIDISGSFIYMVAGTAGKCIQGFPGVSFVLVRKGFIDKMKTYPKRSAYLHLPHYVNEDGKPNVPYTPAVQLYYAFDEALNELLEEGVENRIQRFQHAAGIIRSGLGQLGIKPLVPEEHQSNSITAFHLPEGMTYPVLHDELKRRGYIIYAGQGQLESGIFRVANIGVLAEKDLHGFVRCVSRSPSTVFLSRMNALILAAGVGKRLWSVTQHRPKCLIQIGSQSLLLRYMEALKIVGIRKVVLVVGYKQKMIREVVLHHAADMHVSFVVNEQFHRGSISSLWEARTSMTDDVLIMDADVLFHQEILRRLVHSSHHSALCLDETVKATD